MSVLERDAITIRDAVALLSGAAIYDSRGRRLTAPRDYSTNRARPAGAEVWSYGSHFPLFRYVHERGRRPLFLINGDRWTGNGGSWGNRSRTPDHQRIARDAIVASGVESCVIPFTALAGAELDLDSVRLVHARPDENWTETRTAETLAGVPRWNRTVHYQVELTAETLAGVAEHERTVWRQLSPDEIAARDAARDADRAAGRYSYGYGAGDYGRAPRLPDADGLYRWTESRERSLAPDADGLYRWTENVHRLGDCLFSAVREITEPNRPAYPFEHGRDNARERVSLESTSGYAYCETAPDRVHESGAGSRCIYCDAELIARTVWRRRARYLSSFDTNENPPLYFLAELPRGAGETVETALDALAPRAVHAAIARGAEVLRQGDIFLIPTPLTDADLTARGVRSRARLTMWSRDARARRGEIGYSAPLLAADRRQLSRIARREYRRERRAMWSGAAYPLDVAEHERRRAESRESWRALFERQNRESATAGADSFGPCTRCGADTGAACTPAGGYETRLEPREVATAHHRRPLALVHAGERETLRRQTLAGRERDKVEPLAPHTGAGARQRWRIIRERYTADLETARADLRRATFASGRPASGYPERRARLYRISSARAALERIETRGPAGVDSLGNRSRAAGRDSYRRAGVSLSAVESWRRALAYAHRRLRPELYDVERAARRRERVRDAVSIYGTAHSATEVLTLSSGAVYVRGVAVHRPELDRDGPAWMRARRPDHRPVYLGNGARWYLAVRNAVPRQTARRRPRRRQLSLGIGA